MKKLGLTMAAAVAATMVGAAAHAATYDFSYTLESGAFDSGVLTGDLEADGNTFDITGVQSFSVNGIAVTEPLDVKSTDYDSGLATGNMPVATLNADILDFDLFDDTTQDTFALAVGDQLSQRAGDIAAATANFGGSESLEPYVASNYTASLQSAVSAAPEPGVWALMLAGVAMIALTLRQGRRQRGITLAA